MVTYVGAVTIVAIIIFVAMICMGVTGKIIICKLEKIHKKKMKEIFPNYNYVCAIEYNEEQWPRKYGLHLKDLFKIEYALFANHEIFEPINKWVLLIAKVSRIILYPMPIFMILFTLYVLIMKP